MSVHSSISACNDTGSNECNQEYNDKTWKLWGNIVNDYEEYKKKNGKQLKVNCICSDVWLNLLCVIWITLFSPPNGYSNIKNV